MSVGSPAHAQLAGSAAVMSDYVYRGGSLTDGDPAVSVSLAYDGPHGLYAGGSAIGDWDSRRGPQVLGLIEYFGYAVRPRRGPTWDFGVTNANYRQNPNEEAQRYGPYHIDATEFHVGMIFRNFSYFAYVSPNYFDPTVTAIYNELNTTIRPGRGWRIVGHVGVLNQLSGDSVRKPHYDISAGLVRPFKGGEARLTWTTTFVATDYPATYARGRGLALVDLTLFF
jgi:uncharacterized protein (TIGR02001 family)